MEIGTFHSQDGLFFTRNEDNSVTITKTTDGLEIAQDGSNVAFQQTLDDGTWCSVVLTMTAHNERPGDWAIFMGHHKGRTDLLSGR